MTKAGAIGAALAALLVLLACAAGYLALRGGGSQPPPAPATEAAPAPATPGSGAAVTPAPQAHQGFLYGRVTTGDGAAYEGRLRFGGGEEAFWNDHFNGAKGDNPWAAYVAPERLPTQRRSFGIFGLTLFTRERRADLDRPFMVRFGDLARIDAQGRDLRVTLKNGSVVHLDRYGADDFADGVRVWDERHGVVDLDERQVRSIELFPTARLATAPERLHGRVRTPHGDFTGFIAWDRRAHVGSDLFAGPGPGAGEEAGLRFDAIRSIARLPGEGYRLTLTDGRETALTGSPAVGRDHRGVFVDDRRYGRVQIPWSSVERVDFTPGGSGPAYGDFPPGRPLTGSVTTGDGRRLAGRLVYDLDESQSSETLDAPRRGIDYSIPFGRVASIATSGGAGGATRRARVTLHDGAVLEMERAGDLGPANAGLLVFPDDREEPEYVPWSEVERIDLDAPPTVDPPLAGL